MIRPTTFLALALATAPAAAGDWTVLDRSGQRVEIIKEGIGDRLIRRDATGRRTGTIEEGIGDQLIIRDSTGRREATVEAGIGDRLSVRDPAAPTPSPIGAGSPRAFFFARLLRPGAAQGERSALAGCLGRRALARQARIAGAVQPGCTLKPIRAIGPAMYPGALAEITWG